MTIGEKIAALRTASNISQEEMADRLGVSRQSVSKWEIDQAVPGVDKILLLAELFQISTDDLLHDEIEIETERHLATELFAAPTLKHKYFGTDGFRGRANVDVNALQAFKVGRFLGWYYSHEISGCQKRGYRPRVVVGKDTRRSSYMFEYALAAGLTCSGADVYILHATTTPSVSYITRQDGFDCGIMISASHNPYYDNGIKLVNRYGEKMDDRTLSLCEAYLSGELAALSITDEDLPLAEGDRIGAIHDHASGRNRYIAYLISLASHSFKGMRIGLDCANGASWMIAPAVFNALGATVYTINDQPTGTNINQNAGSTHIEVLQNFVLENHLDAGFAFDGDADRCLAVDEKGRALSGDHILYILANRLKSRGTLGSDDTIVTTIMSNTGFTRSLKKCGISTVETNVGDQNVYRAMQEGEFMLGGEQSGHIILSKYATTGDGILTAIMLMEEIIDKKSTFSKLADPVTIFPQVLKNLPVTDREKVMADPEILEKIQQQTKKLGDQGRILVRASGTEPVVRVMVEAETEDLCARHADKICKFIEQKGYLA